MAVGRNYPPHHALMPSTFYHNMDVTMAAICTSHRCLMLILKILVFYDRLVAEQTSHERDWVRDKSVMEKAQLQGYHGQNWWLFLWKLSQKRQRAAFSSSSMPWGTRYKTNKLNVEGVQKCMRKLTFLAKTKIYNSFSFPPLGLFYESKERCRLKQMDRPLPCFYFLIVGFEVCTNICICVAVQKTQSYLCSN